MFFNKKDRYATVFKKHYKRIINIIKDWNLDNNAKFEVLTSMYVISDFAITSAGKDRQAVAQAVMSQIDDILSCYDKNKFYSRVDLYGSVIRGKELRLEWFLGDRNNLDDNVVIKCAGLLGDILYNPECADDYDNAPVCIYGIDKELIFANNIMIPIIKEVVLLFNEMFDL